MRVLVSAYACAAGRGSEPEVGLRSVLAALSQHETWVLTRDKNVQPLEQYVADHAPELLDRLHVVGVDLGATWRRAKRLGAPGMYAYYDAWQRRAGRVAVEIDDAVDLHLAHHVTFAAYWTRAGVAEVRKPVVWGPVGGGVRPPVLLLPVLGLPGVVRAGLRTLVQRAVFRRRGGIPRHVRVVLAQNPETAELLGPEVAVVPNAIAVELEAPQGLPEVRSRTVIFAGRLVSFKAGVLAVHAMSLVRHRDVHLVVCGDGPDRPRLERAIQRSGLQDRITLLGNVPREELVRHVASASVLLHPALHEDAGLSVAEALSLQTPVVCLDHGGPAALTEWWGGSPSTRVRPSTPARTARELARAIDDFLDHPVPTASTPVAPQPTFTEIILRGYDTAVAPATAPV